MRTCIAISAPPPPTPIDRAQRAKDIARRRRLGALIEDLAELDGELVLQAAALLEPYERARLAVLFNLAADQ